MEQENSDLVWAFAKVKAVDQVEVGRYIKFAASACIPGGGCDTEQALDVLYKCQGSITQATSCLLSQERFNQINQSTIWTMNERQSFERAFQRFPKDFCSISRDLKTKTVKDCVRYYYLWKNRGQHWRQCTPRMTINLKSSNNNNNNNNNNSSLNHSHHNATAHLNLQNASTEQKHQVLHNNQQYNQQQQQILVPLTPAASSQGGAHATLQLLTAIPSMQTGGTPDSFATPSSSTSDESRDSGRADSLLSPDDHHESHLHNRQRQTVKQEAGVVLGQDAGAAAEDEEEVVIFPCKVCGREFAKIKSRSAHMKRHKNERLYGY